MSFKHLRHLNLHLTRRKSRGYPFAFEKLLQETLHSLKENGLKYELKVEQRKANEQLF